MNIRIRQMTSADLPLGIRLKTQAGWNQLEGDWLRMLELEAQGCFVGELAGQPVGTVATCTFGPIAWVAMVLVDEAVRGRGIGTALMKHALQFLDQRGIKTVRLDATPLGQPLYEKLGFVAEIPLARYGGSPSRPEKVPLGSVVMKPRPEEREGVFQLDLAATQTDRRKLLLRLFRERPENFRIVKDKGRLAGYLSSRPGSLAVHLGPGIAAPEAGPLLFAESFARHAGQPVFIDIPTDNRPAVALAEQAGLTVQRPLVRMSRGPRPREDIARLWAAYGPELG